MDGILRFIAGGGFLTIGILAPNSTKIFDKPAIKFLDKLDKRAQDRELRRVTHYMKQRGLITFGTKDYEHGIELTDLGIAKLNKIKFSQLSISRPEKWDKKWRIIFFDVPEIERAKRNSLTLKIKQLGLQQLQKSIWIHPYPFRGEIEYVGEILGVRNYITYIEVESIDNQMELQVRFKSILTEKP